jgi:hypothetical protein
MPINRAWHDANRMPKNATKEQRLAWHLEHAKVCGCRPMPDSIKAMAEQKGKS